MPYNPTQYEYIAAQEPEVKYIKLLNKVILNSTKEGLLGIDENGNISFINPAAEELLNLHQPEILGKPLFRILRHSTIEGIEYTNESSPILNVIRKKEPYSGSEELFFKKDNDSFLVEYRCMPILDETKALGAVITFNDITENMRMRAEINSIAQVDDLTGLYNRRGFNIRAHQQLLMAHLLGKALYVVYLDLDYMKAINDNYGHQAGDQALKDTSAILKKVFRTSDIIARIGGDEFAVCAIAEPSESFAELIENRLKERLIEHNTINKNPYELSFSLGIVYSSTNSKIPLSTLLKQADELMYLQKNAKRTALV